MAIIQTLLENEDEILIENLNVEDMENRQKVLDEVYHILKEKLNENEPKERESALKLWQKLPPLTADWVKVPSEQPMMTKLQKSLDCKLRASDFKKLCDIVINLKGIFFIPEASAKREVQSV